VCAAACAAIKAGAKPCDLARSRARGRLAIVPPPELPPPELPLDARAAVPLPVVVIGVAPVSLQYVGSWVQV